MASLVRKSLSPGASGSPQQRRSTGTIPHPPAGLFPDRPGLPPFAIQMDSDLPQEDWQGSGGSEPPLGLITEDHMAPTDTH